MPAIGSHKKPLALLAEKATRLRIDSIRATRAAGSGHPTSCASAAEIMSAILFPVMRYDPADPRNPRNDREVLSKGHAAPILVLSAKACLLALAEAVGKSRGHRPQPADALMFNDLEEFQAGGDPPLNEKGA